MTANDGKKAVIRAITGGRSFVLPLHRNPDADSLGSSLALSMGLAKIGKRARVVSADKVPEIYDFLQERVMVMPLSQLGGDFDTVILVDSSEPSRAGLSPEIVLGKKIISIDHHRSSSLVYEGFVDSERASSAELVYELLQDLSIPVDTRMASLLYLGLMTDTGCFRYENSNSLAFDAAASLVALGVKPAYLARNTYDTRSLSGLRLLGMALSALKTSDSGELCWTSISLDMIRRAGASPDETDGIVNYTKMVPGVEVGVLFTEQDASTVRVGLRSKDWFPVNEFAASFNGGGHARAAGFTFEGSLKEAESHILALLSGRLLERS